MEIATVVLKTTDLILKVTGSSIFKEVLSIRDYEEEIKMLADVIKLVGGVLCDAECMKFQECGVANAYSRLRNAFLDAEDLLDEVETQKNKLQAYDYLDEGESRKKKKHKKLEADDTKMKETCCVISRSNSTEVLNAMKEIRRNLDVISLKLPNFGISTMESTGMRTRETCSSANVVSIIGRDEDKRKIIDLLLGASIDQGQIPVVSIVGIAGMGKTTVAQIIYDDESRLESCKFDLKLWVADSQKFDLKLLLQKILKSISPADTSLHNLELDQLKNRLSREITGKKYLLVLDDVENESRGCWIELEEFLKLGAKGSRILVTTRSRMVANVMGVGSMIYELKCLSEEDSWSLFEEMAFKGSKDEDLVKIGKCILKKCGRVPLAIKAIGSLLCGQDQCKWEKVRDHGVEKTKYDCCDIISILRLSYDSLDAKFKECFRYCALFPRNWPISKENLVNIWMSNVSIETDGGQCKEDVCDEIIKTLYSRCFLEEMERKNDDTYFKMHDLAKEVAGEEMFVVDSGTLTLSENIRHLNLKSTIQTVAQISTFEPNGKRLRTLLHHGIFTWRNPWEKLLRVDKLMSDFPVLRMLDLQKSRFDSLPESVGKLIHLRYLDLSYNSFHTLPDSIVELWNLQSLLLKSCNNLKELPMGFRKLINLRHLNLEGCDALTCMPSGIGALKSLRTLNIFIVGDSESEHTAKLEDLELLSKLQGDLIIKLPQKSTITESVGGGPFLLSKERLRTLKIEWSDSRYDLESDKDLGKDMDICTKLQPHSDLEKFTLYGYECLRFPPWADDLASLLPNLVSIIIDNSRICQHLPSFSKLRYLKRLTICHLLSLEYMEESAPGASFFPSLEYFWLMGLPNLKGWCTRLATKVNDNGEEQSSLLPSFPLLSDLHIYGCPKLKMTSFPGSPIKVYSLKGNEDDVFTIRAGEALSRRVSWFFLEDSDHSVASSSMSFSGEFHTNDERLYFSIPWEQYLRGNPMSLKIKDFNAFDIPSASMIKAFRQMSKCVTSHEIKSIPGLKTIPIVLQYLTALRELSIVSCDDFTGEAYEEDNQSLETIKPWEGFESLGSLSLYELTALVRLPKEIQFATSLQVLEIYKCTSLKGLSTGIRRLINLRYLSLEMCVGWAETFIFVGSEHPSMSQFQWLKCLSLNNMPGLVYIQENNSAAFSFPSLECIFLRDLPQLRDWCRGPSTGVTRSEQQQSLLQSFPRLSRVGMIRCPNFDVNSMLLAPVLTPMETPCYLHSDR